MHFLLDTPKNWGEKSHIESLGIKDTLRDYLISLIHF